MGSPTDAERDVLEGWRRERDELDSLIAALERRIAARSSNGHASGSSKKIDPDEFYRLSTPDAIKKFLRIVGKPARAATDIVDGLKAGGLNANYTNVYTALTRLKVKGEVAKVGDNWGLEEWYPPAAPRESRPENDKVEQESDRQREGEIPEKIEVSEEKEAEETPPGKASRKEIMAEFIRSHGPSTRSEILAGTGIPDGSFAYCAKDEKRFAKGEGRKWRNVE